MTLRKILKERHNNFLNQKMREYYIHGTIPFVVIEELDPEKVNIGKVINTINRKIPKELFYGVDGVYITHLPEFDEREINALYKDAAIYVTSHQDNSDDLLDDIVHELAHATETYFEEDIYGDEKVEVEFLAKRKKLYRILKNEGYVVNIMDFLDTKYNHDFDFYLYDDIGYNALSGYCQNVFLSPYSMTSLREYYAVAFTDFFLFDRQKVKNLCPVVYQKVKNLIEKEK
jgi:hypothetical protein